jgi:O-antigen/teichoic acid export membrane protein
MFFLALTFATLGSLLGRIGLDNTLLRYSAANAGLQRWGLVKGVYRKSLFFALIASALVSMVLFTGAPWIADTIFREPGLAAPLQWLSAAVIPITIFTLSGEALKGIKKILQSQLVYGFLVPVQSLVLLLALRTATVRGAAQVYTVSAALTALAAAFLWRRAVAGMIAPAEHFPATRIFNSSLPLFWVKPMTMAVYWIPTFLLGYWESSAEVSYFNVAARTAVAAGLLLIAVDSIAAPKIAALHARNEILALGRMAVGTTKLLIAVAAPILVVFIFFPDWIIGLYGPEFIERSSNLLSIIALGQAVNISTGPVAHLLMMSGHERLVRNIYLASAVLSLALNLAFIPRFGVFGAAWATSICLAFTNLTAMYQVWKKLGILTFPLPVRKFQKGKSA